MDNNRTPLTTEQAPNHNFLYQFRGLQNDQIISKYQIYQIISNKEWWCVSCNVDWHLDQLQCHDSIYPLSSFSIHMHQCIRSVFRIVTWGVTTHIPSKCCRAAIFHFQGRPFPLKFPCLLYDREQHLLLVAIEYWLCKKHLAQKAATAACMQTGSQLTLAHYPWVFCWQLAVTAKCSHGHHDTPSARTALTQS